MLSSDGPSLSAVPAVVPGMLIEPKVEFALMLVTALSLPSPNAANPSLSEPSSPPADNVPPSQMDAAVGLWVVQQMIQIGLWQMSMGDKDSLVG